MPIKRIIMVHGIGNNNDNTFADSWKAEIIKAFPDLASDVEFEPLYWEDLLREAARKWPLVDAGLASVLAEFGLPKLKDMLDGDNYKVVSSYVMDVMSYVVIPDATVFYLNACLQRLEKAANNQKGETLIIAHSLGAAMIPHLLWSILENTGSIPFHSLILLATPMGFASPINSALGDFLEVMGRISGTDRATTLRSFAQTWARNGAGRLHFISNTNDIVCHDARFNVAGTIIDIIPIRQGFDNDEVARLDGANRGCHHQVTFGSSDIGSIGENHDVVNYIKQQTFRDVLGGLLNV